jgi:pimeloyl-ACP methyl ester carboxylesterase
LRVVAPCPAPPQTHTSSCPTDLFRIKAVVGHSFGCGTALLAMKKFRIKTEKLILFSCFDDIDWITNEFGKAFSMNGQTIAAMRNEAHRRYKRIFSGAWEWQELSPINTIQEIETEILYYMIERIGKFLICMPKT